MILIIIHNMQVVEPKCLLLLLGGKINIYYPHAVDLKREATKRHLHGPAEEV